MKGGCLAPQDGAQLPRDSGLRQAFGGLAPQIVSTQRPLYWGVKRCACRAALPLLRLVCRYASSWVEFSPLRLTTKKEGTSTRKDGPASERPRPHPSRGVTRPRRPRGTVPPGRLVQDTPSTRRAHYDTIRLRQTGEGGTRRGITTQVVRLTRSAPPASSLYLAAAPSSGSPTPDHRGLSSHTSAPGPAS